MNFLSHHQLNRTTGALPALPEADWFVAGVMIPDLWSAFRRDARWDLARTRETRWEAPRTRALQAGLLNHVSADATFHTSDAFRVWRRALVPRAEGLLSRRSLASFLAHIGVELVLDRVLLVEVSGLGTEFYDHLDRLDPEVLTEELVEVVGPAAQGFARVFATFRNRRHLLTYDAVEAVAASVERIFGRIGKQAPDRHILESFLEEVEDVVRSGSWEPRDFLCLDSTDL